MTSNSPFWRSGEPGSVQTGSGYQAAVVCRRGHTLKSHESTIPDADLGYCTECGARLIARFTKCGIRIRGSYFSANVIGGGRQYEPPPFCDNCGDPHPWASRSDRISQLMNLLDEEEITPEDRLVVTEALEQLRQTGTITEPDQRRLWKAVKDRAPGIMTAGSRIVMDLATAKIRQELGLP
jgi:hypothetical protein